MHILTFPPSSGIAQKIDIVSVTADYLLNETNRIVLCDCSTNDIVLTLPNLSNAGGTYKAIIKKVDTTANRVIIMPLVGTIDGSSSKVIEFGNTSVTIVAKDDNFYII